MESLSIAHGQEACVNKPGANGCHKPAGFEGCAPANHANLVVLEAERGHDLAFLRRAGQVRLVEEDELGHLGCKKGLGLNSNFELIEIVELTPYLELSNLQRA